jgi:DNA-binding transcriptional LysR family regulator
MIRYAIGRGDTRRRAAPGLRGLRRHPELPAGSAHRDFIGRAIARLGQEVAPPIEADGWPLMLQFVALGLGVAVVNAICTPPRGLVLRPLPELGTVCYRLVTRRGATLTPAAERLAAGVLELGREVRARR